jgi:pyruvate, orthophosphate dikinase
MSNKYVYSFRVGKAEGKKEMKELLGGKGANLAEMTNIGLPVPPGFTITTETCRKYYEAGRKWPRGLKEQIDQAIKKLEADMSACLGDKDNPLLVSVRSGAAVSMPGMMDTILNLGMDEKTIEGLIKKTGNDRFAWDAYRRFIQMFGNVVKGINSEVFEEELEAVKAKYKKDKDTDLTASELKEVADRFLKIYKKATKKEFPRDPRAQLEESINAVFQSWNNQRAIKYREIHKIKGLLGTAVNVQAMVFGNMGRNSGTGVAFTRDPSTGANKFYGEYLMDAQGEDVVAGIRTPEDIQTLKKVNKKIYDELAKIRIKLERHYKDMQDLEFTIQEGRLYILQTRGGKRTAAAAVKIAVDMAGEKLISRKEAVRRVDPEQVDKLLHPIFDPKEEEKEEPVAKGLPASPGAATGEVVFTAEEAEKKAESGKKVILCRTETSPEDIGGMNAAVGILTSRGGMTSHAAVVARGMGKCCVAGAHGVRIDYKKRSFKVAEKTVKEGAWISINGYTGGVYLGKLPTVEPTLSGDFTTLMKWADKFRALGVRANADTPEDAALAVKFGAEGIGLCRTEHMFFEGERITAFREMILADSKEGREKALKKLLPMQRHDFEGIFKALKGRPCTVRLLDPPLHEFLPHDKENQRQLAKKLKVPLSKIKNKIESLKEMNPMLGHRGCRLGLIYPEISDMQIRAIIEAAIKVKKQNKKVLPEIMIPLVGHYKELQIAKERAERVIRDIFKRRKTKINYRIGTMIEVPRAAVTADEIAQYADFFSFGTNDLTQMGCGFSRDDAGKFLPEYTRLGIYSDDPFQVIDQEGVGKLITQTVALGRKAKKEIKLGICGEHGGEPKSVEFCHRAGLNYVSCSPFRVPVARLAAAQAAIKTENR